MSTARPLPDIARADSMRLFATRLCAEGDAPALRQLFATGFHTRRGRALLEVACAWGQVDTVRVLLEADPEASGLEGERRREAIRDGVHRTVICWNFWANRSGWRGPRWPHLGRLNPLAGPDYPAVVRLLLSEKDAHPKGLYCRMVYNDVGCRHPELAADYVATFLECLPLEDDALALAKYREALVRGRRAVKRVQDHDRELRNRWGAGMGSMEPLRVIGAIAVLEADPRICPPSE